MNPTQNKTIGIDVCKNSLNIVRLERQGEKIILTESIQIPLNIKLNASDAQTDPKVLSNAIKSLKLTKRLEHCDAALCLGSSPDLLQILKLPEATPHNIIKYIHDEIRQYAVLPLKNIKTDYCALRSTASADSKQVLVGACPTQPLVDATRELERYHIDIGSIEPAVISLIRACYRKMVCTVQEKNTMFALLGDDVLNICVFNGQKLDFLRTKKIDCDNSQSNACLQDIATQIQSVLQFYELEKTQQLNGWQIFLSCRPNASQAVSITEQLKNIIPQNIEVNPILPEHLNIVNKAGNADFSAVAVGAAMKLLNADDSEISINLVPDEISEIRKSNKQLLVIINTAAAILVLLFIHIAQLGIQSSRANTEITKKTKMQSVENISNLSRAKADVNEQTARIAGSIAMLERVVPENNRTSWAYVLAEVSKNTPKNIQIQTISSMDSQSFVIEGTAVNYAAVTGFISSLSKCKTIGTAHLEDTKQNMQYGEGFIDYSINCSLASQRKGN